MITAQSPSAHITSLVLPSSFSSPLLLNNKQTGKATLWSSILMSYQHLYLLQLDTLHLTCSFLCPWHKALPITEIPPGHCCYLPCSARVPPIRHCNSTHRQPKQHGPLLYTRMVVHCWVFTNTQTDLKSNK